MPETVSFPGGRRPVPTVLRKVYPESAVGGFPRADVTIEFYGRINALLRPGMVVVDFGAGRGKWTLDEVSYRRELRTFQGKVGRVIGVDVDPVVRENPAIDQAVVLNDLTAPLPFDDASIDIIVSESTFEHLANPARAASEFSRVLKPGGWICARTPNRWGYIGIGANIVPNRWHVSLLRKLQPRTPPQDVFPTHYRANTRRALMRVFEPTLFDHFVYTVSGQPAYFGESVLAWRAATAVFRLVPPPFSSMMLVFLRRRE